MQQICLNMLCKQYGLAHPLEPCTDAIPCTLRPQSDDTRAAGDDVVQRTLDIAGIPATVKRSEVVKFFDAWGIPVENVIEARLHYNAIELELYALDPGGYRYILNQARDRIATHTIMVPVVEG